MSNYSEKIYGVRFGYFNSCDKFIIYNEYKFDSLDDIHLKRFKKEYLSFKYNNDNEHFIFHFYKSLENALDDPFFLWVGVSLEIFEELMNFVTIDDNENITRNSSYNSCNSLNTIHDD